jgi:dGTPase
MTNQFYQDFDRETASGYPRPDDYRTPFQVDRDRILHTSAFRRLQSKTQVFLSGEYDFYRTRLTHSLEVAQVGRSICQRLKQRSDQLSDDYYIDADLVEAACLSHDLGHPPFGHSGERTLHHWMRDFGGFEGNAQTLRMLTETIYANLRDGKLTGMKPTRAFLDSILKYKAFHHEVPGARNHFIYDDQETWLAFVFGMAWREVKETWLGSSRNSLKSIECQVMDWADDTAYSLNDLVDGINVSFITTERIERWAATQELNEVQAEHVSNLLRAIREERTEPVIGRKIGEFIAGCHLEEAEANILSRQSHRYRFNLVIEPEIREEADLYKRLALDVVFRSQQLQQLDYKGDHILRRLLEVFAERYLDPECPPPVALRLLPPLYEKLLGEAASKAARARILCDYLATMTDGFATRTYKRLFDAEFGSIVDLV